MFGILKNIIGNQNEKELKRLKPFVDKINSLEDGIKRLSDEELKNKTNYFKELISKKEEELGPQIKEIRDKISEVSSQEEKDKLRKKLRSVKNKIFEDILYETFAVVRETARRTINMRHFDVQLMGGIALHEGKIAEMATGEGKTLVATLPAYLNALIGEGVHIVTVNDYLAKRDRTWMGPIYEFLGLSIGVIQHDMDPQTRKQQYACDITYGTNNEFGFDYLRDNLVIREEDIVQRKFNFAIVDEVDSILVDEARTPLIISGPIDSVNTAFVENRGVVEDISRMQVGLIGRYLTDLKAAIEKNEDVRVKELLYIIHKGSPKNRDFLDLVLKNLKIKAMLDKALGSYDSKMMEQERQQLLESLFFVFDERTKEVTFTSKGEDAMKAKHKIEFIIEDIESKIAQLSAEDSLSEKEKLLKEDELTKEYIEQQKRIDSIKQLLKAYILFKKDVDYVISDNKIVIVDEFTGRMMPGRRFSDGIHEALESKERVEVQRESQTHATITLQNYFKMYDKLSGMTGTAATEANEFDKIYSLEVIVIPPNKPLRRESFSDVIYKTEKEKFNAICDEIKKLNDLKRPVLVGTISIEKSEILGQMLKRRGVPHNVLNAKYHETEANIVAQAGSLGAVTIATNMAGRGTDILLGGNPEHLAEQALINLSLETEEEKERVYKKYLEEYKTKTEKFHDEVVSLAGLFVIGTERHESRRVDNQLRGRAGRQGDPGSSKFYLSLEDDLMRIFGSDRIKMIMDRLGMEEGQEIQHPLVSKAISTAQKRVETQNFEIRQHLLKFDNVMNQQREIIYERRRKAIKKQFLKEDVIDTLDIVINDWLENYDDENFIEDFTKKVLFKLLISIDPASIKGKTREEISDMIFNKAKDMYERREKILGPDKLRQIEQYFILSVIDASWKDYLFNMDQLREGINWRAYGQRDPLVEYKHEAFGMFQNLVKSMDEEIVEKVFKTHALEESHSQNVFQKNRESFIHEAFSSLGQNAKIPPNAPLPQDLPDISKSPVTRNAPKVGRNDPCPCGSGKKYKKCCGK